MNEIKQKLSFNFVQITNEQFCSFTPVMNLILGCKIAYLYHSNKKCKVLISQVPSLNCCLFCLCFASLYKALYFECLNVFAKEQHTFKNVNNCVNTNIYSYLETSCGQSYNLYLNVVHFFNASVNLISVAA